LRPREPESGSTETTAPAAEILLVPLIDVNWLVYAPFDPARGYRVDPPDVAKSIGETRALCRRLREQTGGRYILTPHSGTYCRSEYYEGEMLEVYREAVADGAELCVHLHEEIKGAGTRYGEPDHMAAMVQDCKNRLEDAGISPVAYRGGHYAYAPFMNRLLENNDILIDCSCAPGMDYPDRQAIWTEAELSAFYLPENPRRPSTGQARSRVFEIPIGSDGGGSAYANILHVEQSDLDNLKRVWAAIRERAKRVERPQIVHSLFHTGSMGQPELAERFRRFLEFVPEHGGAFVTTVMAKAAYDHAVEARV